MAAHPRRPEALRGTYFRGRDAIAEGLVSKRSLRSGAWRRVFRGIYVDSSIELTYYLRCLIASTHVLPSGAVFAGRTAAALLGTGLEKTTDPVEALVPRQSVIVPHAECIVHRGVLPASECEKVEDLWVTTPARTCWDLARWLPLEDAVAVIDRMLAQGIVTIAELAMYLESRASKPRPRGWLRFNNVLSLADGRAESPMESRLRVRLVMAGLPPPEVQFTIRAKDGTFIARVDLAWPDSKVASEYDGQWHGDSPEQIDADRRRRNAVEAAGWVTVHITHHQLLYEFDSVVSRIAKALSQ